MQQHWCRLLCISHWIFGDWISLWGKLQQPQWSNAVWVDPCKQIRLEKGPRIWHVCYWSSPFQARSAHAHFYCHPNPCSLAFVNPSPLPSVPCMGLSAPAGLCQSGFRRFEYLILPVLVCCQYRHQYRRGKNDKKRGEKSGIKKNPK